MDQAIWIVPVVLICFFIFLAYRLALRRHLELPTTPENLASHFSFLEMPFGKIWHYDNTTAENQDQMPWFFIHSIGSSMYCWRHQFEHFHPNRRIIALDLLGFGKSDKPLDESYDLTSTSERLIAFLDKKEIKKCHLVGCSLGGALALWLQTQHPQRFLKAAVIAPAATSSVVPFLRLPHDRLSPLGQRIVSRPLIKAALIGGLAHRHKITPDVLENYYLPYTSPSAVTCFLRTVSVIKDPRVFQSLDQLTPDAVLVLWGLKDRVIPRKALEKIRSNMPPHHISIHPQGGHHLMEDEPEWVNEQLQGFLS